MPKDQISRKTVIDRFKSAPPAFVPGDIYQDPKIYPDPDFIEIETGTDPQPMKEHAPDRYATTDRPSDKFDPIRLTVDATPNQRVLGRDPRRRCVTFYNAGSNELSLGADGSLTYQGQGSFPLPAGASFCIETRAEWYAIAAAGNTSVLAILSERWFDKDDGE